VRRPLALALVVILGLQLVPAVVQAQTTEADVFVAQAVIDFDDKHYDAAIENLRHALELEPDHTEALYYMGVVQMALRRPADAVPFLTRARQKSPRDPSIAFQLGLAYFGLQQYDQAAPILEDVFRSQPTLDGLGYYVGFMRYRKKDYRPALDAFRAGRATDPDIQQLARFYGGLALAALGLPSQAAAEVDQALRLAPGSSLTGPAERLRDTIVAARGRERRLSAELRVGEFFDDNVAVVPNPGPSGPDGERTLPLIGQLRRPKHESTGEILGVRADYSWLRDVLKRDDLDSTVGVSLFGTYDNQMPDFNLADFMANGGLTYRLAVAGMPAQLGMQYAWDKLFLHRDDTLHDTLRTGFLTRNTATVFGALVEGERGLTQVFFRYQNKLFNREREREATAELPAVITERREIRDADNWMGGFLQLFRFQQDAHFVKLGYQFDYEDSVGLNFQYRGHRFTAGGQYTLPWHGARLKLDFDGHLRDYTTVKHLRNLEASGPSIETLKALGVGKRRHDEELTITPRVELPLGSSCLRKNDCVNWTLAVEGQRTMGNSNVPAFDYTRNVVSVILSLTY
jgi:Flp pilus assembly protein TadD